MEKELVHVFMVTYNHEKFIAQAVDSVLMQKTSFKYKLIIGEDCSTDSTRAILKEYEKNYPEKIKVFFNAKNLGATKNAQQIYEACTAKYIAMCEGDDYWTDPLKLQKQVDFFEKNEDYSICFHPVKIWKEQEQELVDDFITRDVPETTTINDLVEGNYIHTPSVVFRNYFKTQKLPANFYQSPNGDYYLYLFNARFGKIKKLSDTMAIYRFGCGLWSAKDSQYRIIASLQTFRFAAFGLNHPALIDRWYQMLITQKHKEQIKALIETDFEKFLYNTYSIKAISNYLSLLDIIKISFIKLTKRFIACV